ncbi:sigma factor-like helix-turn-helix DNA-binding protein [Shouchella lonarensis]|uniref:Sigma-70, region 4 n=1 Tax=Shouchella lonarensis TaxID=1464122 RepID=A0A1G6N7D3_9BACI|nr:sigma factor-like helix-turn-helix DNA-binding protein [Shouchella lonarensis]SDC63748.1 Sigma-70, region 4 [Shouchella lonarensis]
MKREKGKLDRQIRRKTEELLKNFWWSISMLEEDMLQVTETFQFEWSECTRNGCWGSVLKLSEEERNQITSIVRALNKLSERERKLLILRYMQVEKLTATEVYEQTLLSESHGRRVKREALHKLAVMLRLF